LYDPTDIIEYIVQVDKQCLRQMKATNRLLAPFGLQFDRAPDEIFGDIAHELSTIATCRMVNTIRLVRAQYCAIAIGYLDRVLDSLQGNRAGRDAWIDLRKAFETAIKFEGNLILATVPFYVTPGDAPLSPNGVYPLVWPLALFGVVQQVTPAQKAYAKEALIQIGTRADAPSATRLAYTLFRPGARLPPDVHLLHCIYQS
jgi:hypothetical protein